MNAGDSGGHEVARRGFAKDGRGCAWVEIPLQMLPAETIENGGEKQEFLEGRRLTRGVLGRENEGK